MSEASAAGLTRKPSKLSGLLHKRNPWHKVQKLMGKKRSSADLVTPVLNAAIESHEASGPTRTSPAPVLQKKTWIQRDDRPPPEEDCQASAAHATKAAHHAMATKIQKVQRGASGRKRARSQQARSLSLAPPVGNRLGPPHQLHNVRSLNPFASRRRLRSLGIRRTRRWSPSARSPS